MLRPPVRLRAPTRVHAEPRPLAARCRAWRPLTKRDRERALAIESALAELEARLNDRRHRSYEARDVIVCMNGGPVTTSQLSTWVTVPNVVTSSTWSSQ